MPYKQTTRKNRYLRRAYRKVIRPYVKTKKGRGRANRMKLYSEISAIKKMVNAEKKTKETYLNGVGVAQLNNAADGIYCNTITPVISQGNGFDARSGRSIKLCGAYLRGKFTAQTNCVNKIKYNMMIVQVLGKAQTTTEITAGMFNPDSLSGIRDYFAPRNPDSFTDYKIIASRNYTLYPDTISGQTGIIDYMMPLKLNHHIRYSNNTNTIDEGELFVIIRADSGDSGSANTGAFWQMSIRFTYYDN